MLYKNNVFVFVKPSIVAATLAALSLLAGGILRADWEAPPPARAVSPDYAPPPVYSQRQPEYVPPPVPPPVYSQRQPEYVPPVPPPQPVRRTRSGPPERGEATADLYGARGNHASQQVSGGDFGPRFGYIPPEIFCQTLDSRFHQLSYFTLGYVPKSEIGKFGESAIAEVDSALRVFALEDFLAGHLEGYLRLHALSFLNNAGLDSLPDVAAHLAFELAATWRFVNGWSLELSAAPGMYSDVTDPQFNCLATANMHYSFTPELAGVAGLTVRPGWDLPVMPNIGFAWEPIWFLRTEAMLPRSRAMLTLFDRLTVFGTIEWRNRDYRLEDKEGAPDAITMDEWLATGGAMLRISEHTRISAEVGKFFKREISAKVEQDATLPVSKETMVRFGLHGEF
jgi:hypothetical protein